MSEGFITRKKWVKSDAWRGRYVPYFAVAGANDTGMWEDSPAPSNVSEKEIKDFRKFLKKKGVRSKVVGGQSSNVFMGIRYVVVTPEDYSKAMMLSNGYMKRKKNTRLIYSTEGDIPKGEIEEVEMKRQKIRSKYL